MSFVPLVGSGGYSGWRLLSRTVDAQKAIIARDPAVERASQHVREAIGGLETADDLMSDYQLLSTALSAFGLEEDIGKTAFIRKVLESDISDSKSFANRLSDKRYRALAEAFGFASGEARPADLAERVVSRHVDAELERRIGTVDGNLRLALNAQRELAALADSETTDNTKWYTVLGSTPLRKVFEGALGLGANFGQLPVDRQLTEIQDRVEKMMGSASPSIFKEPENVEKLIQRFLLRSSAVTAVQSSYSVALTLLSD